MNFKSQETFKSRKETFTIVNQDYLYEKDQYTDQVYVQDPENNNFWVRCPSLEKAKWLALTSGENSLYEWGNKQEEEEYTVFECFQNKQEEELVATAT